MSNQVFVPKGEETVTVELTVKELLALSGAKFTNDKRLVPEVRRKLRDRLDRELMERRDDREPSGWNY
ncbi:hypothetical protein J31TS4_21720 [Paenibacillus sp. J31TS4]|uniref:hypothetical protein n=1 Tax=Paenibacillus sp. J31TS4 TaxID=2807195 RepID=UPI001B0E4A37|nr:hypothetical protein [Paenibacillus sp. J31TS4]GIP38892.1 hypothetical protein J31TS4_21720 [Paenibacillus sp. J31TS4]